MYRRPKFLQVLIDIREQMAADADYDVELLAQKARTAADAVRSRSNADPESQPLPPAAGIDYTEFLENLQ